MYNWFPVLFQDTWLEALEVKLELFVEKTLRKPVMPRLLQMLENKSVPVASDEATANYIASMQANLRVADEREAYHMSRQQKLQVDYQNLISISSELVQLLASSLKGEQV